MIFYVILIISLAAAFLTAWLAQISYWWVILLFVGYDVGLTALFFIFAIIVSFTIKKNDPPSAQKRKQNKFYRWIMVQIYTLALHFMRVHPKVTGLDKLPPEGTTFMLVSNHLSNYDHMTIITKLKKHRLAFVSKPENFSIPIVGKYLQESAFLPIDRSSAGKAMKTLRSTSDAMKEGLVCYGIFPEGTRSRTGEQLPFHDCAFLPAKRAEVPIVVVHMSGSRAIHKHAPWLPTRVYMDVLGCMSAEYVKEHDVREICEEVEFMMTRCKHQEIPDVKPEDEQVAVKI